MSLPLTDSGLIGTCLAASALGLIVLTSSGGSAPAPEPAQAEVETASVGATGTLSLPASATEDAEFGAKVRDYLLQNPEVIFEAVAVFEQRNALAQADMDVAMLEANEAALFEDGFSWVGGNPDGDVRLVEFIDYRCAFCKRAHSEVAELLETDGNIRLIVKEFPILGPESAQASRFAIAVLRLGGDDAYKAAHDALIEYNGAITPDYLEDLAATLDLDFAAVSAEMESEDVSNILAENYALAQRLQISGTPTFVMETEMIRGYVTADVFLETAASLRN